MALPRGPERTGGTGTLHQHRQPVKEVAQVKDEMGGLDPTCRLGFDLIRQPQLCWPGTPSRGRDQQRRSDTMGKACPG